MHFVWSNWYFPAAGLLLLAPLAWWYGRNAAKRAHDYKDGIAYTLEEVEALRRDAKGLIEETETVAHLCYLSAVILAVAGVGWAVAVWLLTS